MGCARKLVFSWGGNPGVGSLHRLRDAVEHGWPAPLELEEHSHAGMAAAYAAGAANLPFGVLRGYAGTDLAGRTRRRVDHVARSPARSSPRCRALRPDVGDRPRAAGGRARATCSSGASAACRRRPCSPPTRSLVTVEEVVHEARAAARRRRAAVVGGHRRRAGARRRAPVVRARLLRPRQRVLRAWDRDQPRPRTFRAWMQRHVLDTPTSRSTARACARPRSGRRERRRLHRGRDDGRRRRAPSSRTAPCASSGSALPSQRCNLARATHAPSARAHLRERHDRREAGRTCRSRSATASSRRRRTRSSSCRRSSRYWLQAGRIDIGFLGAAQIDRLRQPQQHRDRRLRPPAGAAAGRAAAHPRSPRTAARCS